jgi:hypothetical protein
MALNFLPVPRLLRLQGRPRPIALLAHGFVLLLILAGTQVHLQSVRWWWSPAVVSALHITPAQAAAIEREYENNLPAQRHASEEVAGTTGRVVDLIRAREYDDELLHTTEKLVRAYQMQGELQQKMLARAARALTPDQRQQLSRLVPEKRVLK